MVSEFGEPGAGRAPGRKVPNMGFFIPGFFVASADVQKLLDGQAKTNALLTQLVARSNTEMAGIKDLQAALTSQTASIKANTDAENSCVVLLQTISANQKLTNQQLADAMANNDPVAMQAALDLAVANQAALDKNTADIAAAVVANTPAAPTA